MSKSNVNPNYYKVAGRERQGEDIAQARIKQKHESLVRRRAKVSERPQPAALERGAPSPGVAPARTAKQGARKARATPLQTSPGQKRGHNLVPGSAASPGVAPARTATTATRKARATPLQMLPGQKRGHNLVPGSAAPHARFPKAARGATLKQKVRRRS